VTSVEIPPAQAAALIVGRALYRGPIHGLAQAISNAY
jgi:hypothetical protein